MLTARENFIRFLKNESYEWIPNSDDQIRFTPEMIKDNVSRGFVFQQVPYPKGKFGGRDMFGVDWYFDPAAGGSMEKAPLLQDVYDLENWEELISFPDLDALDWEGCARENREYLQTDKLVTTTIFSGFFERLISFVGFEDAAVALVDEELEEAVRALFERLADYYAELVRRMHRHFNVQWVELHDDWGTQISTMFSPETYRSMILPYVKKVVDSAHAEGVFYEQHSCGFIESIIGDMISSGADTWRGQNVNDKKKLVEQYGRIFKFGVEIKLDGSVDDESLAEMVRSCLASYKDERVWIAFGKNLSPDQKQMVSDMIRTAQVRAVD